MGEVTQEENREYVNQVFNEAINWLNVIGEYDTNLPKVENKYNRQNVRILGYFATLMAQGSWDMAQILSAMEREAITAQKSEPDSDIGRVVRTNQMYSLARIIGAYKFPSEILDVR